MSDSEGLKMGAAGIKLEGCFNKVLKTMEIMFEPCSFNFYHLDE